MSIEAPGLTDKEKAAIIKNPKRTLTWTGEKVARMPVKDLTFLCEQHARHSKELPVDQSECNWLHDAITEGAELAKIQAITRVFPAAVKYEDGIDNKPLDGLGRSTTTPIIDHLRDVEEKIPAKPLELRPTKDPDALAKNVVAYVREQKALYPGYYAHPQNLKKLEQEIKAVAKKSGLNIGGHTAKKLVSIAVATDPAKEKKESWRDKFHRLTATKKTNGFKDMVRAQAVKSLGSQQSR